jgi:hypothetical protein
MGLDVYLYQFKGLNTDAILKSLGLLKHLINGMLYLHLGGALSLQKRIKPKAMKN